MNQMKHSLHFEGGTTPPDPPVASLIFEAPHRGRPPRHWADLSPAERREQVEALGHSAYRARQLSAHYFEGLRDDPAEWTDLPADVREAFAEKFMPRLLTPVRELRCDGDDAIEFEGSERARIHVQTDGFDGRTAAAATATRKCTTRLNGW